MSKLPKYKTRFPGVRYYEHPDRQHKGKPDQYFCIRYMVHGKQYENGLGWASLGMSASEASQILAGLKKARRTGEGPVTLQEKKDLKKSKLIEASKAKLRIKQENRTFDEIWEKYFPHQKSIVSPRSWKREESLHRHWISPVIGDMPMKHINQVNLQKIRHEMEKVNRSPRSICYAFDVIRQVFNFGKNNGLIGIPSPTKGIKKPQKDNKRYRHLSPEEAGILLNTLKNRSQSLYEIALISLHCGLRAGEIFSLKWSDVDLNQGRLILRDTKGGTNRFPLMTSAVKEIFSNKSKGLNGELVFPDRKGRKRWAISNRFAIIVDELGFNEGIEDNRNKLVFHTLRHTYASWLVQEGVSIYEVSKLLGHSTITMTERYSHLSPKTGEKSLRILEAISERGKIKDDPKYLSIKKS
jgi:integrase